VPATACPPPDCGWCCHWVQTGSGPSDGYCALDSGSICGDCADCGPCYTCSTCHCLCDWDCVAGQCCSAGSCVDTCPGGQCCYDGVCVDTCPNCYECVDGDCVPCKCWDVGGAISGSISVQDAKLCEEKTHTSVISKSGL